MPVLIFAILSDQPRAFGGASVVVAAREKVTAITNPDVHLIPGERPPLSVRSVDDRPPPSAAKLAAILAAIGVTIAVVIAAVSMGIPRMPDIPWPRLSDRAPSPRHALAEDTSARLLEYYARLGSRRPLGVDRIDHKGTRDIIVTLRLPKGASLDPDLCLPAGHALWRSLPAGGSLQLARADADKADLLVCGPEAGDPHETVAGPVLVPKG